MSQPGSMRARLPRLPVALAVPAVLAAGALLSACGGSSSPSSAANEQAQEQKAEAKFADFARCLREHGMDAEAVTRPGGGHGLKIGPGNGATPQTMEATQKACARYQPAPQKVNLSPQQKVELEERVQKFARCMREHGIKVETSTAGGGVRINLNHSASSGEPNPESPAFQRAQSACQKLLPQPPGGKRPGFAPAKGGEGGGVAVAGG